MFTRFRVGLRHALLRPRRRPAVSVLVSGALAASVISAPVASAASAYSTAASFKPIPSPVYAGSWALHSPMGEAQRENDCQSAQRLQMGGPALQAAVEAWFASGLNNNFDQPVKDDAAQQTAWDNSQDSLRSTYQSMLGNLPVPTAPGQARSDSLVIDWPDGANVPWAQIPDYNSAVRAFLNQRTSNEANPASYPDVVIPADQAALDKSKTIITSSTDPLLSATGGLRDQIANPTAGHYATDTPTLHSSSPSAASRRAPRTPVHWNSVPMWRRSKPAGPPAPALIHGTRTRCSAARSRPPRTSGTTS